MTWLRHLRFLRRPAVSPLLGYGDGARVVGIAAYLTALGANLHRARLQRAERIVTRDGTMVVQGCTGQRSAPQRRAVPGQ